MPGGATRVLFLAQHFSAWFRPRESQRLVHVAQLLSDQRNASHRCNYARSLSVRRRIMAGTAVDSELNAERGQPCPRDRSFQARADKAVRAPPASVDFRLA